MRAWFLISALALALLLGTSTTESRAKGDSPERSYELLIPSSFEVPLGGAQELTLGIQPANGYRIDENGPLEIELLSPATEHVVIKRRKLRRRDAVDPKRSALAFSFVLQGKRAGSVTVAVHYRFWLCRSQICLPIRGKRALPVEVVAPPPEADAGPADAASRAP